MFDSIVSTATIVVTAIVSLLGAVIALREILKKLFYNQVECFIAKLVMQAEMGFGGGHGDEKFLFVVAEAHKILPIINQLVYSISDIAEIVEKMVRLKINKPIRKA